jgi:hypothetical protein
MASTMNTQKELSVSDRDYLSTLRDIELSYFVNNGFSQAFCGGQDGAATSGHPSGSFFQSDPSIKRKGSGDSIS